MDLTTSYESVIPEHIVKRYDWLEVRNAATILAHTNPEEFDDLALVLDDFTVDIDRDIKKAGGNESDTAAYLNARFREMGWREGSHAVQLVSTLRLLPYTPAGETAATVRSTTIDSPSYLIDNVKGRVALDVEWHAKDGNLDRDIASYRALYDSGIIDVAVMVTMNRADMRAWALAALGPFLDDGKKNTKFGTSTTTNIEKARPRLERGDGGGCPILVAAVCRRTS